MMSPVGRIDVEGPRRHDKDPHHQVNSVQQVVKKQRFPNSSHKQHCHQQSYAAGDNVRRFAFREIRNIINKFTSKCINYLFERFDYK